MLWIEPCTMLYSGILGGLIGGFVTAITIKRSHNEYVKKVEHFWNEDIKMLHTKIIDLSTKKVDKTVHKDKKHTPNNKYWYKRHIDQRG